MESRPIYQVAREIATEWKNVYFGAEPYLKAMHYLSSASDRFGSDDARSIVVYFLANAQTFRGPKAKELKAELKQICGIR
jgi:hypothetical protein